jgi:hypothetical protein
MGELNWTEITTEVPAAGIEREREATAEERQKLAEALGILCVSRLLARYRLSSMAGDAYRLTGALLADVEQACIVSLESVSETIDAGFEVEFHPRVGEPENATELGILDVVDVEPLEGGIIPVGRIVYETLSSALDPYPRRQNATFSWQDPRAEQAEKASPFAVLAALKNKP